MTQQEDNPSASAIADLERARQRLQRLLGREPTNEELAREMKLP